MKTDSWIIIRGARQLLTLHRHSGARRGPALADLGLIVDGSVLMRNGIVEAVGPTRRIENMAGARNAEEIDASGRVVMPAFIDPHACLVPVPAFRNETYRSVQALPATRLEAQADALIKVMARHGTATIGALSGYGIDSSGELKILRALRAKDGKPINIVSILYLMDGHHGDAMPDLLNCVARRKLARITSVRCGEGGIPRPAADSYLIAARALGLAVRLEMLAVRDADLVEVAVNLRALSVSAPGAYRTPEIEMLSDSSTFAILLPQLASPTEHPGWARDLVDSGALIALGSGLNPEVTTPASMQTVIQLACDRLGLSLNEAISAATINAAWALGVGAQTGSLERGKQGDIILLNASDYREISLLAGTNLTHLMLKRGVVLFKEDFTGWPAAA
jgi:imidazolonepropionase